MRENKKLIIDLQVDGERYDCKMDFPECPTVGDIIFTEAGKHRLKVLARVWDTKNDNSFLWIVLICKEEK